MYAVGGTRESAFPTKQHGVCLSRGFENGKLLNNLPQAANSAHTRIAKGTRCGSPHAGLYVRAGTERSLDYPREAVEAWLFPDQSLGRQCPPIDIQKL